MVSVKGVLGGMILVVILASIIGYGLYYQKSKAAVSSMAKFMPDLECPSDAEISMYVDRMRFFASEGSGSHEPGYAIELFHRYLACRNPRTGNSRFTTAEIEQSEPQILACAHAAYRDYKEELQEKIVESQGYPEDLEHYTERKEDIEDEHTIFQAVFPASEYSGTMCNYEATGRSSTA